jgi:hypothetical protein
LEVFCAANVFFTAPNPAPGKNGLTAKEVGRVRIYLINIDKKKGLPGTLERDHYEMVHNMHLD